MRNQLHFATLAVAAAALMTVLAPRGGFAQNPPAAVSSDVSDARWRPWLGCWMPVERAPRDRDIQVCVTPGSDRASVRLTTFAGDQRILQESILADGSTQTMREDSCRGSSRSQWSRNASRLFRVTALDCDGNAPQRTTEIAAWENPDEWLDVQVMSVGGSDNVRIRHYIRSALTPPSEVRDLVRGLATRDVAVNASASAEDVIEANAITSPQAVEAWLSESEAPVPVHKNTLLALNDAKVPSRVIDLMIARAYPRHFEVRRSSGGAGGGSLFDDVVEWSPFDLMFDPYAFYYSPFGSYRRFVDPTLYPLGGYVIVPASGSGAPQESGAARVVNGAGYTRVEPRQPAAFVGPRLPGSSADSSDSGSSSSAGSSASSDGGSASAAGYSAGGGGAQTAVPR